MFARLVLTLVVGLGLVQFNPARAESEEPLPTNESNYTVSENELPRGIERKMIEDDEVIQAVEAYEFEYIPESSPDYEASQTVELEPVASASEDEHHDHHSKVGYSVGGPLVNIAQGAAQQAKNFEKSQPAAAAQAAYVAKNRLGQSAGLSAATAAAAFAGKQIILRGLEQQAYNAQRALQSEKLQLQQAQRAATAAANAASQATHQLQVITTALNAAQATSEHASAAASEAAAELAAQTSMVGAAKARLHAIEDQLHHARIDFDAAQRANSKAAQAARLAQNNAAAAAAHAAHVAQRGSSHVKPGGHSLREEHPQPSDDEHDEEESVKVPVTATLAATDKQTSLLLQYADNDTLYDLLYDGFPY